MQESRGRTIPATNRLPSLEPFRRNIEIDPVSYSLKLLGLVLGIWSPRARSASVCSGVSLGDCLVNLTLPNLATAGNDRCLSTGNFSPSAYLWSQASPALVVAIAFAPAAFRTTALRTSQQFGRTRI